jgi:hypothetical protein
MSMRVNRTGAICSLALLILPAPAANVTVNVSNTLSVVAPTAFGIHTSVYDNQNGNAALPGRLIESGVNTLRYPGGGYADVYHWSRPNPTTPWFGGSSGGYIGPNTDFGHFVQLLSNAGAQAVITVNYGSSLGGTTGAQPQEAAAWVAYANGDASLYGSVDDVTIGIDAEGRDWKTVGYWARLRTLTTAQNPDNQYDFLAIAHAAPFGIKYWEIGNETFGTAYYDQFPTNSSGFVTGYSECLFVPYNTNRVGAPNLSPAFYGQKVNQFAAAMKAVDPTIRIGTVLSTPPDDYNNWDFFQHYSTNFPYNSINGANSAGVKHWNPEVLAQCASNTDFVIAHWYPYAGNNADGTSLLSQVPGKIPQMINGTTSGLDTGGNAGLRDWINTYRPTDGTNVQIFITEFGYMGSLALWLTNNVGATNVVSGPANALFVADSYASWMDLGVANIDYLEMNKSAFLGDSSTLVNGMAYYAIQLVRKMAGPGDRLVKATSDQSSLRTHAAMQQSGRLGLLLINTDRVNPQTVNVTVTNVVLDTSGTKYQFGTNNFNVNTNASDLPLFGPSTNSISGLSNSFSVVVPPYTMWVMSIPTVTNTAPVLAAISNRTVNVGQTVAFTAGATDAQSPPQTLTFSLINTLTNGHSVPPPANATLGPASGAFSWQPLVTQADTTNPITVKVIDSGTPGLSATQSFTVVVSPLAPAVLSSASTGDGQVRLSLEGSDGPDYAIQASTNLVQWETILTTNSPPMPFSWTDPNSGAFPMRFYRVIVGPPLP